MSRTLQIGGAMHAADGSGFYRFILPFGELAAESHHISGLATPGQPIFNDPSEISSVDVLVLQRPATKAGVRQMEQVVGKTKVVYETDDDLLQADSSGLPHLMDEKMRESIRRCMRLADMVTVSTPYLAEQVSKVVGVDTPVVVLPNCVNEKLLKSSATWRVELDPDRRLKVGWAGGTSHLYDMVEYADGLRSTLVDHPEIDMHFAGYDYSPLLRDLRGRSQWSTWLPNVADHYKVVSTFDIGLAPLAQIPFNRSKSHLKCLEYAACGIPTVATDMEPYHDFVVDGVTGFLVSDSEQMAKRLHELISDADMRREMGAAAKKLAAGWTIQANWRQWESAYELAAAE